MICREESLLYARLRIHRKRVDRAREIVAATLDVAERPYIGFSTGKDSTCVLHLVREQAPDVPAIYFDADCSLPESEEMLVRLAQAGVAIERWKTEPLIETYRQWGMDHPQIGSITTWTTVGEPLYRMLDERNYDFAFLGLRAEESRARLINASTRGEIYNCSQKEIAMALPILWWTEQDVWAYIHANGLDYNRAYEKDGVTRISYWAGTTNDTRGRFVELKRHWPGLFNRLAAEFPEVTIYG